MVYIYIIFSNFFVCSVVFPLLPPHSLHHVSFFGVFILLSGIKGYSLCYHPSVRSIYAFRWWISQGETNKYVGYGFFLCRRSFVFNLLAMKYKVPKWKLENYFLYLCIVFSSQRKFLHKSLKSLVCYGDFHLVVSRLLAIILVDSISYRLGIFCYNSWEVITIMRCIFLLI